MKTAAKIARFVGPRLFLYGPQIPRYLALVVALFMASSAGAAEIPDPTVTVRVYNYAEVSAESLRGAESEASRIFTTAGVETKWVDCSTARIPPHSALAQPQKVTTDCFAPISGAGIVLRILARSTPASSAFRDTMFGFAEGSFVASVFYARLEDFARRGYWNQSETPVVLGDVIAHEIGHLLLGSNSHSRTGIMCGRWDREYLRLLQEGFQTFSADQSSAMRATVLRRGAQR